MLYAVNLFTKENKRGGFLGIATGRTYVVEADSPAEAKELAKAIPCCCFPNMSRDEPMPVADILAGAFFWAYNILELEQAIATAIGTLDKNPLFNKQLLPKKARKSHKALTVQFVKRTHNLRYHARNEATWRSSMRDYMPGGRSQVLADTTPNFSGVGRPSGAKYCVASYRESADKELQKTDKARKQLNRVREQLCMARLPASWPTIPEGM